MWLSLGLLSLFGMRKALTKFWRFKSTDWGLNSQTEMQCWCRVFWHPDVQVAKLSPSLISRRHMGHNFSSSSSSSPPSSSAVQDCDVVAVFLLQCSNSTHGMPLKSFTKCVKMYTKKNSDINLRYRDTENLKNKAFLFLVGITIRLKKRFLHASI